jgi:hypothetical protein
MRAYAVRLLRLRRIEFSVHSSDIRIHGRRPLMPYGAMRVPRSAAVQLVADLLRPVNVLAIVRSRNRLRLLRLFDR